jgi:signal transduction histidine kinase
MLPAFENALVSLDSQFARLQIQVQGDTVLASRVRRFEHTSRVVVNELTGAVAIREARGFDAARDYILLGRDEELFQAVDSAARAVISAVDDVLARRTEQAYVYGVRASLSVGMLAVAAVGLLSLVYVYVRRDVRKREQVAHTLAGMNAELERRVRIRTEELSTSNARLESVVELLRQANRELRDFTFAASHHFQEPLRKITLFSGLLLDEDAAALSDRSRTYIDRLTASASRLSRLIRDYLEYAQINAQEPAIENVHLADAVQSALRILDEANIDPPPVVELGALPTVRAEALQMEQLFEQLIDNAVKFRNPDRRLELRIEGALQPSGDGSSQHAVISVADNGIGFKEKYQDRIFTPFQRLHDGISYEGTGIGLAICRRIVERHNGTITVQSRPGRGSVFTISLPAAASFDQDLGAERARAPRSRTSAS